jgi:hypothetical protein
VIPEATADSISADPMLKGMPSGFTATYVRYGIGIRELCPLAGSQATKINSVRQIKRRTTGSSSG